MFSSRLAVQPPPRVRGIGARNRSAPLPCMAKTLPRVPVFCAMIGVHEGLATPVMDMTQGSRRTGSRIVGGVSLSHGGDTGFCVPGQGYLAILGAFCDARR